MNLWLYVDHYYVNTMSHASEMRSMCLLTNTYLHLIRNFYNNYHITINISVLLYYLMKLCFDFFFSVCVCVFFFNVILN